MSTSDADGAATTGWIHFNNGKRALKWAIDAGLPLLRNNHPAHKVYQGSILAALIWIRRNHPQTNLMKVQRVLGTTMASPDDLRYTITRTNTSLGGSRRDLPGVRLAYWLNQEASQPFVKLTPAEWQLLNLEEQVDIANDPAVLFTDDVDLTTDPAALSYLEFAVA